MVLQNTFLCDARYQLKVKFVCDYPTVPILFVKNILYLLNCISVSLSKVNQQYMCCAPWTWYPAGLTTTLYLCCYHTVLIMTDWKTSWSRKSPNVVLAIENLLNSQLNFKSVYQFRSVLATFHTAVETPWPWQLLRRKRLKLGTLYSFRGLFHYRHVRRHGGRQADLVLGRWLRVWCLDPQSAGRERERGRKRKRQRD